jgi:enamine deaminase RidA (YjgF/YER057c/UK114 family)
MAETAETRLKALGITLHTPGAPQANYIPHVITGRLLFASGQISVLPGGASYIGKLGREFTVEQGREAARICAINLLANFKAALGDLEKIGRIVKLTGFVNSIGDFDDAHLVVNGCSDLLVEVLGERGRHARSAFSVASLPRGAAVEAEAIVEIA